jgi:hypothetical protein
VGGKNRGHFVVIHVAAFHAAFFACAFYVWRAGGWPEKLAALAQAAALCITVLSGFGSVSGGFTRLVDWWALADSLLAAILILIALRANRLWPILLAGLQVSATFAHLTKAVFEQMPPTGYAIFVQMWSWPMLAVTTWGTRNHQRRLRKFGSEADWKSIV